MNAMITIEDMCRVDGKWFITCAEIDPISGGWKLWRRWYVEICARRTDWPMTDSHPYITNHYYMFDFYAFGLHRAVRKASKVMWDTLIPYMESGKENLPE
jgi:hypothetical protein